MSDYLIPQIRLFQDFEIVPDITTRALRSVIIGCKKDLIRFADEDEREDGAIGEYAGAATIAWPNLGPAGVVDTTSARIYATDALLAIHKGASLDNENLVNPLDGTFDPDNYYDSVVAPEQKNVVLLDTLSLTDETKLFTPPVVGDYVTILQTSSGTEGQTADWTARIIDIVYDKVDDAVGSATAAGTNVASTVTVPPGGTFDLDDGGGTAGDWSGSWSTDATALGVFAAIGLQDWDDTNGTEGQVTVLDVSGTAVTLLVNYFGHSEQIATTTTALGAGLEINEIFTITHGGTITKNDTVTITGEVPRIAHTTHTVTEAGAFNSKLNTVYGIEVVEGGNLGNGDRVTLRIYSTTKLDPERLITLVDGDNCTVTTGGGSTTVNVPLTIGTKGVTADIDFVTGVDNMAMFYYGDVWTIQCTGFSKGGIKGFLTNKEFAHYPSSGATISTNLEFLQHHDELAITPKQSGGIIDNWTADANTGITLEAAMTSYDAVLAEDLSVVVQAGFNNLYVEYAAVDTTNAGKVVTIEDSDDDRLGIDDPDNELGYAARLSLINSGNQPTLVAFVEEHTSEAYAEILDAISIIGNAYSICPLTTSQSLQDLVIAHCTEMSDENMNRWRTSVITTDIGSETDVLTIDGDGDPVFAEFINNPSTGTVNKLRLTSDVDFLEAGVKAGDTVRYAFTEDQYGVDSYSEFVITQVLSPLEVIVLGTTGISPAPEKIEIWKETTAEDVVTVVGGRSEGLSDRRVTNIFPPKAINSDDVTVPGIFVAAAYSGLRSGVAPHQGLTNSRLTGFKSMTDLSPASAMSYSKTNELAGKGVTIIGGDNSNVYVRHAVTTSSVGTKDREEMITRNIDSISFVYYDALGPYVGIANVTPEFIEKLRTELKSIKSFLVNSTKLPLIGSQLLDCIILEIKQNEVLKDRVDIRLQPIYPFPFNGADIHLQI